MSERESGEIIRQLENSLGLASGVEPTWGYDLNEAIFPEEAPTKAQRKFAGWCLRNLSFFVTGYAVAAQRGQVPPLTGSHVQAFYLQEREELRARWNENFADFTLTHVLGAAIRLSTWLEELKVFEETSRYDRMLQRLRPTRQLLEQTLKTGPSASPRSPSHMK